MGKIYCMMGKSSSGKDTLYQKVLERLPQIHRVVPYTTRPIREGEQDGVEYHFVDDKQLAELETDGKIVELRAYNTVHGIWKYFTVDDGQIDLEQGDYLLIAVPTFINTGVSISPCTVCRRHAEYNFCRALNPGIINTW